MPKDERRMVKLFIFFVIFVTVMGIVELILIAIGLSMDAFAVAIGKGLSVNKIKIGHAASVAVWFGGFQALMPIIGYFLGVSFASLVESIDHWIAFCLLGFIGFNMIHESLSKDCERSNSDFSAKQMFLLAVATSIDALAVGLGFGCMTEAGCGKILASVIIGIVAFVCSFIGAVLGKKVGKLFEKRAELFGGIILVVIGIKMIAESFIA